MFALAFSAHLPTRTSDKVATHSVCVYQCNRLLNAPMVSVSHRCRMFMCIGAISKAVDDDTAIRTLPRSVLSALVAEFLKAGCQPSEWSGVAGTAWTF